MKVSPCTNCGGTKLFRSEPVSAGGGHAPNYLPGLGGTFSAEKFVLVLCKDCGLTRFFAKPTAIEKLSRSKKWRKLSANA